MVMIDLGRLDEGAVADGAGAVLCGENRIEGLTTEAVLSKRVEDPTTVLTSRLQATSVAPVLRERCGGLVNLAVAAHLRVGGDASGLACIAARDKLLTTTLPTPGEATIPLATIRIEVSERLALTAASASLRCGHVP